MDYTAVPQGVSDAVGAALLLVDYPEDFVGVCPPADSGGSASVSTDPVDPGFYWRVERLTTVVTDASGNLVTPPAGALLNVYKGTVAQPIAFRDGSMSPGLDVADESQPITVRSGESLLFQYTGLTPGTIASCTAQYALYVRVVGLS